MASLTAPHAITIRTPPLLPSFSRAQLLPHKLFSPFQSSSAHSLPNHPKMGSVHSSFLLHANPGSSSSSKKASGVHIPPNPLVHTDKGPVEGRRHKMKDGRMVNVFLGIPFAKPPVGPLRFKKPEKPEPWGPMPLQSRRYKPRAIQRDFFWDTLELRRVPKSEDCLYLNVVAPGWDPPADSSQGWPVMVYIHGGGYIMDSAVKYHYAKLAQSLVRHGVIVVTVQYRLGLLGFFCSGDDECKGNFGLWDQLFALQWVNKNIASFGGDPGRITLFGHSAGAASADLLSLSPLSRDLFSQVILMGGSAETIWAVSPKEVLAEYCRKKAKELGYRPINQNWDHAESERMLAFLRTLAPEKFELTLLGDRTVIDKIRLAVSPVIDGELLPKSPKELRLESPAKRVICGQCRHEGLLFLALGMRRANGKLLAYCEKRLVELLAESRRRMPQGMDVNELVPKAEEIREFYQIDNEKLLANKPEMQRACVTIMSDLINNLAIYNFCRATVDKPGARVWRFMFDHYNPDSSWALNPLLPFKGSTHGNELHYVFDINFFVVPWRRTAADRAVLEMTTRLWTNFAKWGDPNGPTAEVAKVAGDEDIYQKAALTHWEACSAENIERHLNMAKEPMMKEGTAECQRVKRLGPAYRALVE